MAMNQGEIIQQIREHERNLLIVAERLVKLEKKVEEIAEIMKSPIRRAVHATRQKREQESDVGEHSP